MNETVSGQVMISILRQIVTPLEHICPTAFVFLCYLQNDLQIKKTEDGIGNNIFSSYINGSNNASNKSVVIKL